MSETLPAMEYLLSHHEKQKLVLQHSEGSQHLLVAINSAWLNLRKYYALTDDSYSIYAAGTMLSPCHRYDYFKAIWSEDEELGQYLTPMQAAVFNEWNNDYRPKQVAVHQAKKVKNRSLFYNLYTIKQSNKPNKPPKRRSPPLHHSTSNHTYRRSCIRSDQVVARQRGSLSNASSDGSGHVVLSRYIR